MKFKILYTAFILFVSAFLFLNSSSGRATAQDEGNTGAPGDDNKTCQNCHGSGPIQVSLDIEVFDGDGNAVSAYIPNQTYDVKVTINDESTAPNSASAFGFQMISLVDESQAPTNSWSNPAGNVKIVETSANRSYAEHKGPSNSNEFNVTWTAPAAGSGSVTFYSAGNGVNSNGASSGDGAAVNSLTIEEDPSSSTRDMLAQTDRFSLFPNPAVSQVYLQTEGALQGIFPVRILTADGREADRQLVLFSNGQSNALDISRLQKGLYWIQFFMDGQPISKKLIKN